MSLYRIIPCAGFTNTWFETEIVAFSNRIPWSDGLPLKTTLLSNRYTGIFKGTTSEKQPLIGAELGNYRSLTNVQGRQIIYTGIKRVCGVNNDSKLVRKAASVRHRPCKPQLSSRNVAMLWQFAVRME